MASAADWDAVSYQRVAAPHAAWGASVLDRLRLEGDETVLDAGCGSGRVTAQLVERLPRGRVIGVDRSPSMLAEARRTLAASADRVTLIEADLLQIDHALSDADGPAAPASTRVDAVFSTATFHWIEDHDRLFKALHNALKPGGPLVAQFGGGSNLAGFMHAADVIAAKPPYRKRFQGKQLWRYFYGPDDTVARLNAAGFAAADAWLEPSPQTFGDHAALAEFARTVVLSAHVAVLPPHVRQDFVDAVVDEVHARRGGYLLDYVRLNLDATA